MQTKQGSATVSIAPVGDPPTGRTAVMKNKIYENKC
jgi:hypothetical protein